MPTAHRAGFLERKNKGHYIFSQKLFFGEKYGKWCFNGKKSS
jgi:hypothetical protein